MYYAAENTYGSLSDIGFANTWYVVAFDSARNRNAWIESRDTLSAKAITRKEVTRYASAGGQKEPRPFYPEHWGIVEPWQESLEGVDGLVGLVEVVNDYDSCGSTEVQRLNK
jgi:hypothetical protein